MRHYEGRVEVICGSMFCGKTEELLRRVRRASIAKQRVQVFKPRIDNRYDEEAITSHDGQYSKACVVDAVSDISANLATETTVVAIDEAQFFDDSLIETVEGMADRGIRVIIAGLDLDFRGEPFAPMPALMARAEEVMKLHAICVQCGEQASRSQRLIDGKPAHYDDPIIMIGAQESYEARCRKHHDVPR